jgi:hypothetical protein
MCCWAFFGRVKGGRVGQGKQASSSNYIIGRYNIYAVKQLLAG